MNIAILTRRTIFTDVLRPLIRTCGCWCGRSGCRCSTDIFCCAWRCCGHSATICISSISYPEIRGYTVKVIDSFNRRFTISTLDKRPCIIFVVSAISLYIIRVHTNICCSGKLGFRESLFTISTHSVCEMHIAVLAWNTVLAVFSCKLRPCIGVCRVRVFDDIIHADTNVVWRNFWYLAICRIWICGIFDMNIIAWTITSITSIDSVDSIRTIDTLSWHAICYRRISIWVIDRSSRPQIWSFNNIRNCCEPLICSQLVSIMVYNDFSIICRHWVCGWWDSTAVARNIHNLRGNDIHTCTIFSTNLWPSIFFVVCTIFFHIVGINTDMCSSFVFDYTEVHTTICWLSVRKMHITICTCCTVLTVFTSKFTPCIRACCCWVVHVFIDADTDICRWNFGH